MTDSDRAPSKNPARAAREKRLAEALRANLRRRKAVAEPRAEGVAGGGADDRQDSAGGEDEAE